MTRLELRNVPADLLRGYLVAEFGGTVSDGGDVHGEGWGVRFIDGEPVRFGPHTLVPVLFVEIEGAHEAAARAFLTRKAMRGGG